MLIINLKTEDGCYHKVCCQKEDRITVLEKKLDLKTPQIFIFRSQVLNKAFTFGFYNILSGSYIYSINYGEKELERLQEKLITSNIEDEKRDAKSIKIESIRIKDFLLKKIESNCSQNRKMLRKFRKHLKEIDDFKNSSKVQEVTVVPDSPSAPSADILPVFWSYPGNSAVLV